MNRVAGVNVAAFVATVLLSTAVAWVPRDAHTAAVGPAREERARTLLDADGLSVVLRDYPRIASASTTADGLLLELCEPERIAAFTPYKERPRAYRFSGKPTVQVGDVDAIVALRPDLLLVSGNGDLQPIARLREVGIVVFDLGEMRGMSTLLTNALQVAALTGHPERGEELVAELRESMAAVAAGIPANGRRRGLYLSDYGGRLFGGAGGTSFDDILVGAGLVEAAAAYRDWPAYAADDVLAMDPDVIVTSQGMRARICGQPGLALLRACQIPQGVVELDGALITDSGIDMVDAALALRTAVYGPPSSAAGAAP